MCDDMKWWGINWPQASLYWWLPEIRLMIHHAAGFGKLCQRSRVA
jgi:hypothetical protein